MTEERVHQRIEDVVLTEQLAFRGFSPDEIHRRRCRGGLHRIRRGAYAEQPPDTVSATGNHLRLIRVDATIGAGSAA